MANPDQPDDLGYDPNKSVVLRNPLSGREADDVRMRGLKEMSGLTMSQIRQAAKKAEKGQSLGVEHERELTREEIDEYIWYRQKVGLPTTWADIRRYQKHVANYGQKDTPRTNELMRLLEHEQEMLGGMRRGGRTFEEREDYIGHSDAQPRIRELYVELGLAEMITLGDWSVNRVNEVSEGFGTVPLDQVEALVLQFYDRVGLLSTRAPAKEAKLIHFHGGCGNGILLEHLRRNRTTFAFRNNRRLFDYWTEVGMADRIYFTLEDLFMTFAADEHKNDSVLREFIKIICTLILRKVRAARVKKIYGKIFSAEDLNWLRLPHDPDVLKDIISDIREYFPMLSESTRISADGEFLRDTTFEFSSECQASIQEFCADPRAFLKRYFKPEFFNANFSQHITIWPHRVIPGRFEDIHGIFPEGKEIFNLAHFYRATSHLEDDKYEHCVREVAKRLKPGGLILDDGWRQSYTRFERVDVWDRMARDFGKKMRVSVIADDNGPKSFLAQRCVRQPDGTADFFSDEEMVRLLRPGHQCMPVSDYARTWPERTVRNFVIGRLRQVFVDSTFRAGDTEEKHSRRVYEGRAKFAGLHPSIDLVLKEQVFADGMWQRMRREKPHTPERRAWDNDTFHLIVGEIEKIRRRMARLVPKEMSIEGDVQTSARTFPRRDQKPAGVNAARINDVVRLPQNLDVPSLQSLDGDIDKLRETLQTISRGIRGKKPIVLIEFDGCFTNSSMRTLLSTLCPDLFEVRNVAFASNTFPPVENGRIYVIGGSLHDAYDLNGINFIRKFCVPMVEKIRKGDDLRAFATCFGSQCMTEAYGQVHGLPFTNVLGALQFGAFPVRFADGHKALKFLGRKKCTVAMTRSGYTLVPGYKKVSDMKPLAFEDCNKLLPPVAFSLMRGRVITSQFHVELDIRSPGTREILRQYLKQNRHQLQNTFVGIEELIEGEVDLPNIKRHVGPAFFVPALQHLASSL